MTKICDLAHAYGKHRLFISTIDFKCSIFCLIFFVVELILLLLAFSILNFQCLIMHQ